MPARGTVRSGSVGARVARIDWEAVERDLGERGYATTRPLLEPEECAELARLFAD